MTGTNCDLFTHKSSRSYLNHLVFDILKLCQNRAIEESSCRCGQLQLIHLCCLTSSKKIFNSEIVERNEINISYWIHF
jgi:hypothetical protein